MKLALFNPWKPLKTNYRREFEYQTSKGSTAFVTQVKDVETNHVIVRVFTKDKESGVQSAINLLNNTDPAHLQYALQHKELIQAQPKPEQKNIEWRDGINHSHKAQRRIVGEGKTYKNPKFKDEEPIRNPVAKHANEFNKSAIMRNRKTDYKRKPKHKNKEGAEE